MLLINRRNFLRALGAGTAATTTAAVAAARQKTQAQPTKPPMPGNGDPGQLPLPTPTAAQVRWQEAELGIIFHFDLPVAARVFKPNNTVRETLDPNRYQPRKLDTDQWLAAAKAAGARYAVFTATHFNGFMQWQSELYPYGLRQTSWRGGKGDVVADFVASCRRTGIAPGIYFSTHRNVYWQVWGHYVDWGKGRGTPAQARFNRVAEGMTKELCSRYGDLLQIWYDAGVKAPFEGGPDVLPIFEKYQPKGVFYHSRQRSDHRWIGNELGHAGDPCWATMPGGKDALSHNAPAWKKCLHNGDPQGTYWSPGMVDVPLRGTHGVHDWIWRPNRDQGAFTPQQLMRMYDQSVGRNCNFVIGAVINPDGLVPESDVRQLAGFGRALKTRFARPVQETAGQGNELLLKLPRPRQIGETLLQEDIRQGERVRAFKIEGQLSGQPWKLLAQAQSIGHKRILTWPAAELQALRLTITHSTAPPRIRRWAVFAA